MPGGFTRRRRDVLPKGAVEVSTLTGLGRRSGLLGPEHKFNRAVGDIAFAYGISDMLSIGLSLDGRYDRHWGSTGDPTANAMTTTPVATADGPDDGYVGDPHLDRAPREEHRARLLFGGQLGVWVPGKDAPSIAGSAISVDARALVSLPAGPGLLSFSGGFRLDNSAKSVDDPIEAFAPDRVSLGVCDYNAVFGGRAAAVAGGTRRGSASKARSTRSSARHRSQRWVRSRTRSSRAAS